jgi:hypothetical protein
MGYEPWKEHPANDGKQPSSSSRSQRRGTMNAVAGDFREVGCAEIGGVSTVGWQIGIMAFMTGYWLGVVAEDGLPGWLGAMTSAFHPANQNRRGEVVKTPWIF